MYRYVKASSFPFELYAERDEYGYKTISLTFVKGTGYEICAEDGFEDSDNINMSEDGFVLQFGIFNGQDVVNAWNRELSARGLSNTITLNDLRSKVKSCYF